MVSRFFYEDTLFLLFRQKSSFIFVIIFSILKQKCMDVTSLVTGVCYTALRNDVVKGGELWMQSRLCGNEYRTTIVCVDSYENSVPKGRFYNPYLPEGTSFSSLTHFLKSMEDTLDHMQLPQSFTAVRAFASPPEQKTGGPPSPEVQEGRLANLRGADPLPPECQLARLRCLAGGRSGTELPQRAGVNPADGQRNHRNRATLGRNGPPFLPPSPG